MRSAPSADDLTAKARIRDAAIRRFAVDGMGASIRAIAADAGVSPALVMHHFGSRAGLREACDAYVHAQIREHKSAAMQRDASATALLAQLAEIEEYAPLVGYVIRTLQAGGESARRFVEQAVADAVAYLAEGEAAGTIRPSRDPEARARWVAETALGSLLLQAPALEERMDLSELPRWLRAYTMRILLPALEMYTEPLLTDSTLLDAYLHAREACEDPGPEERGP